MRFSFIVSFVLLFFLSACSHFGGQKVGVTRYVPPGSPGGRLCSTECQRALGHCEESCGLEERGCYQEVQRQAISDYEAYVGAQYKARRPVELHTSDFENMDVCRAKSCRRDCQKKYDKCYGSCGGKVEKETSCRFLCFD